MKFWNEKNKIEFFHNEPSIIDNFPIIESKDLKLNWVHKTKQDYQNIVKESGKLPYLHLSRCPGIFDLFKYGYIVSLHKDIIVQPESNTTFRCQVLMENLSPEDEWIDGFGIKEQNESRNLMPNPPWSRDFIIKIDTGWHVIAPKGLKLMVLPIAYPDTFDFTSAIGILDPTISTQVNFQIFWNGTEPETLIKAGTPLGHIIPLSERKYQMVQRIMNQQDRKWIAKTKNLRSSSFWSYTIRKKMVNMYNKFWKR